MRVQRFTLPVWLAHTLHWQRGPVPWQAVVRSTLSAGALLAVGGAAGHPTSGVIAALGAMLTTFADRPGSRRRSVPHLGLPALAGAVGMLAGTPLSGSPLLTLALTGLALVAGALSAAGPVASTAGTQFLITAVLAAGMPLPEPAWQRAALFLAGACWTVLLRVALPAPGARLDFLDGERAAVAAAYDAVADLLAAAGGPHALARRAALTAALDRAQDALAAPRRWHRPTATERLLRARFTAVLPLAEAATALTWAAALVPARAAEGPRRLAAAVRSGTLPGPLPAPLREGPGLRALDDALLRAAVAFGSTPPARMPRHPRPAAHEDPAPLRTAARRVFGPAGREYGVRVAGCVAASTAAAQALHPHHWYWLPVTAVFLVKPDLGPLASRAINRALGTVAGALLFAVPAAALPAGGPWPYALALACSAALPVAGRHFAAQTGVVTLMALAFVTVGGDKGAYWNRIGDTLLACAIVLLVGHLPWPVRRGADVRARLTDAAAATDAYLGHVLDGPGDREHRFALRRAAYRSLAHARSAAELAAAELPSLARHSRGATGRVADLERLVDAATATAVHLDHGDPAARARLLELAGERSPRPAARTAP
ncbi:FUSC family protein [Actinacidiphila acididurans]|uniref:FUSC family protein n=1 Tax=Actinacidiphila acididurans TaxID=2784346 RepID=A0ABS2TXS2_9ACTN|nr:FUSC family protein [Actinacidiphila acididurans]MBM9507592.1 FUSC family protein [Actinacidiphila acididurans]